MSIQHIVGTATVQGLEPWGPVGTPLGQPICQVSGAQRSIPGREEVETGIWECSPGRFRRQVAAAEVMHFLMGRCTFTPDGGTTIPIAAGDTLFFPPNTTGLWDIQETVRKTYVLL